MLLWSVLEVQQSSSEQVKLFNSIPRPSLFLDEVVQCHLSESQNWRHAEYVNTKEVVSLAITGM